MSWVAGARSIKALLRERVCAGFQAVGSTLCLEERRLRPRSAPPPGCATRPRRTLFILQRAGLFGTQAGDVYQVGLSLVGGLACALLVGTTKRANLPVDQLPA